jgi:hypothetical protein
MWGPLFDGEGIEFEHLQRMAQLQQQQRTNKLLQEMANNAAPARGATRGAAREKVDPVLAKQRAADRKTNRRREAAEAREAERKREQAELEKHQTKSGGVAGLALLISALVLLLAWALGIAGIASYGGHALVASLVMGLSLHDMRSALAGMFIGPLFLLLLGCLLGWLGFSAGVMTVSYLLVLVPTLAFFLFEVSTLDKPDTQQQRKLSADGVSVLTGVETSGLQQENRKMKRT